MFLQHERLGANRFKDFGQTEKVFQNLRTLGSTEDAGIMVR